MSEQTKIITEKHELVMEILKTGTASVEQGNRIDELEALLYEQKCFKEIDNGKQTLQGEEIASLFFSDNYAQAIDKMIACDITPEDFFGFVDYHYDDEHEDEDLAEMFTDTFIADVNKNYETKLTSK